MKKTWSIHATLVFGLAVGVTMVPASGCGDEEVGDAAPVIRSVRYVRVSDGNGSLARSFSGSIRAGNQSRLAFQVGGRVQELSVRVGDTVERGQQIAQIDATDFELQLQEARASSAQARAQTVSATANYERVRQLYESSNASRQDLDTSRAAKDSARSASAAAGQAIRRLQNQLQYATLSAPGAGTISEVSIEASEVVSPGQVVALLQVGEQLEVAVGVPEALINRMVVGGTATINVGALEGRSVTGTIYEVGTPTGGAAIFPVTIRLDEPDEALRAGMAADVVFDLEEPEGESAMRVPATAVGEDREGRFVFVIEETGDERGLLHRAPVEVGGIETEGIEILSGIEVGQLVVTAGVARVSDGLEVRVPPLDAGDGTATSDPEDTPEGAEEGVETGATGEPVSP